MGSLFNQNFKRKYVDNDSYLMLLTCYIHLNPVKHGFSADIKDWEFISIHEYVSKNKSWIKKELVLVLFNSLSDIIDIHLEVKLEGKILELA